MKTAVQTNPSPGNRAEVEARAIDISAHALSSATTDFLELRHEARAGSGGTGQLAELVVEPHLAQNLIKGQLPAAFNTAGGRKLFVEAVSANLLLGFIAPTLIERNEAATQPVSTTRDRIFNLYDFAETEHRQLNPKTGRTKEIWERAKEFRTTEGNAIQYHRLLSHGDSPTNGLNEADWAALFGDTLKTAQSAKVFLNESLPALTAHLGRLQRSHKSGMLDVLKTAVETIKVSRANFLGFCERKALDPKFMADAKFWSLAEEKFSPTDGSSPPTLEDAMKAATDAVYRHKE